jgi:hypothetical protein
MAGDNKGRKARPGDDLLDWFTISYRTLFIVGSLIVAAGGYAAYRYFGLPTGPVPVPRPAPTVMTSARFSSIEGNVRVKAAGVVEWVPGDKDTVLNKGDRVKTGPGSTAEITFFDGTLLHVRPDSIIMIEETSENPTTKERRVRWNIPSGDVFFTTSEKNVEGSRTDITTPNSRVTVTNGAKGNITVDDSGAGPIRIFSAQKPVQIETKNGEKLTLASNESVKVDVDGKAAAKMALPEAPALLAPQAQTEISYPDPAHATTLFVWRAVPNAAGYHFQIDYSASFNRPIKDMPGWKETAVELRGLDVGKYYWRVAAIDKQNAEGNYSDFARFSIMKPSGNQAPPPPLTIESFDLRTNILQLKGHTEPGATVSVNGQPLDVQPDGSFNEFITLDKGGAQTVVIRAVGVNGGVSEQRKPVVVSF